MWRLYEVSVCVGSRKMLRLCVVLDGWCRVGGRCNMVGRVVCVLLCGVVVMCGGVVRCREESWYVVCWLCV